MRKIHLYITTLIALSLVTLFVACEKDEDIDLMTISVATEQATPSYTSATIQCRFATKATLRNVYVQYATTQDFAEYEEREMANVDGIYVVTLDKLLDNTVYYVRYAVSNRYSSAMVEEISTFKTLIPSVPSIVLDSITSVWDTYANVKIRLAFDGGAPIQEMGICWGTQAAPVVENNKLTTKDTLAVLAIKDLQPNTKYHVRAYAVNKAGIAYSEEYELTTYALPEVKTEEVTDIQLTSALVSGTLVFNGNDTATVTGFCWGANEDPTLENEHAEVDTTSASYMYRLSNLKVETQYYVRAYAQNRIGVVYGEVKSFTTKSAVIPTITTSTITQVTETTAVAGGNVTSDGGASVTERGVVYSTSANPTTANSKVTSGNGTGSFTCNLTGLQPNTTYYVRAYAVNSKGTSYGEEVTFNTLKPIVSPTVTTSTVSQIAETTAVAGGNVTSDGGASVTERGVVYSTSSNPTMANSKVASGSGTGAFTCNLTGLQPNTTYYVRAYAVNSKGTAYGDEVSFTTNEKVFAIPEYVDLGLSVKWATFNVGATKPEEYGDYFAWGETEPKEVYDWSTYKWCNGSSSSLTKYCTSSSYGTVDNKKTLELSDDAAYANWGGEWRTPTDAELTELRTQCTWTWTNQNGVKGYQVTGTNGNSIFLPAAGYRYDISLNTAGSYGYYWSNTLSPVSPDYAYRLYFSSSSVNRGNGNRYYGQTVRPVYGALVTVPTVTTGTVTQITETTAVAGGNVTSDGGASVTERGVVYSTTQNPTVANSKVASGIGTGAFTCNLTGLQPNTTYYVRAYAKNDVGIAYGDEVSFTTKEEVIATPEYVDLGLSVKWATFNIGATKPEEYGDYFAWGETEPKSTYSWSNYKWCRGSETTLTKYCNHSGYGTVDNKTTLELNDDVAAVNWGGKWRMPTDAEMTELREQCTWTWTTLNGVNGYEVTSNSNGNSIFLPAAGWCYAGSGEPSHVGSHGDYLLSSQYPFTPSAGRTMYFYSTIVHIGHSDRYEGHPVRPVYGEYVVESGELPTISTLSVTNITETTAVVGGNITSDGGTEIIQRGVVYNTDPNPTRLASTYLASVGTGSFTCNLTRLQPNTTYYVRAYAVNSKGTAYGEEVSFTTQTQKPTIPYFSVSETKNVTFSSGNLQYHPANNKWRFAENQTDYIGDANSNISSSYNGWLDLFGWSTNSTNFGVSTSEDNNDYSGSFVDWGTNQIGADAPNTWRTLTLDEWNYLLRSRPNASSLRGVAQVNGVNGLIFLPDNWVCPAGVTFKSGFHSSSGVSYYAVYQTFTADQWSKLEAAGAVFLPAAGYLYGSGVNYVQYSGGYWSATDNGYGVGCLGFGSSAAGMGSGYRGDGLSVRLVKDL